VLLNKRLSEDKAKEVARVKEVEARQLGSEVASDTVVIELTCPETAELGSRITGVQ